MNALLSKVYFGIGVTLMLLQFPVNVMLPKNMWSTLFRFIIFAIAVKFMLIYNNKKYSKK